MLFLIIKWIIARSVNQGLHNVFTLRYTYLYHMLLHLQWSQRNPSSHPACIFFHLLKDPVGLPFRTRRTLLHLHPNYDWWRFPRGVFEMSGVTLHHPSSVYLASLARPRPCLIISFRFLSSHNGVTRAECKDIWKGSAYLSGAINNSLTRSFWEIWVGSV